ncbi:MAG: histidine ammonia-lyase [Halodesulfurarchaeum sp.]
MNDTRAPVTADGSTLTIGDVVAVARDGASVEVPESAREAVRTARQRVEDVLEAGDAVYGVNTGFGDLADTRIPREDVEALQANLVRSHAAGAGEAVETEVVRAMMLARLNTLVKGYSGVREVVVDHLATMLEEGIHPVVYTHGSLGASGDLAPLAHMALVLIGEGEAEVTRAGETVRLPGDAALAEANLEPLTLRPKEGIALINGTQLTVGMAALLVHDARRALRAADVAGALTTEVTMSTTATSDPMLHAVRPHDGQQASARNVKRLTAGSAIVESHRNCDRVQDPYSIRCLPQVHGAVRDAIDHLASAVEVELNSATDNPLVFPAEQVDDRASGTDAAAILSGGNFHGEPLALRLDYLTAALGELAAIAERRIDRLLNPHVQEAHLPPFLAGSSGVESGLMLAQYTAASMVDEVRSLGRPSLDNVPVSGNQEDHVSMSAQSAFHARRGADAATTVVGLELLCAAEAARYVDDELDPGRGTGAAIDALREEVAPLDGDRPLYRDIERASDLIADGSLLEAVHTALDERLE